MSVLIPQACRPETAREFEYCQADFDLIARILYDETGIHLPPNKSTLVYSRVAKRLRALGLESFRQYCKLIGQSNDLGERAQLIASLTTNVTRFFREEHHFKHLRDRFLPPLIEDVKRGKRLRIWSAGCSSGQEPYSIALTILSLLPDARSFDVRILATDINRHVLDVGRRGAYNTDDMGDIPADLRNSWMEPAESGTYLFDDAVRGLVSFRELNLMGNWPMRGPFDTIFCRNVVIYFDEATQSRIWNRMMPLLADHGVLYIGHSERVNGTAQSSLQLEMTTTYRKRRNTTCAQ